jgi:cell filamentation protein
MAISWMVTGVSKYGTTGLDDYEPGSNGAVLRNLVGVVDPVQMGQIEYEALVKAQDKFIKSVGDDTVLSVELIREMHRSWLGRIYAFAGALRNVDITAPPHGEVPEFRFSHAAFLESNLAAFEANQLCRYTPCREKDLGALALQLAEVQAEFIMIHPFREGNGRVARWVTDIMALQADRPILDYDFEGVNGLANRAEYYRAMHVALQRLDYGPLAHLLTEALLRAE